MDCAQKSLTTVVSKTDPFIISKLINNIHNEYCLKRNQFNPAQLSPNIFCNRLERRMKIYYNNLYKSFN